MKKKIYSVDNMTMTEPKWFSLDTILSCGDQGTFLQILCSGKHFHFAVFEELLAYQDACDFLISELTN